MGKRSACSRPRSIRAVLRPSGTPATLPATKDTGSPTVWPNAARAIRCRLHKWRTVRRQLDSEKSESAGGGNH